jgi:hypothetical protein
MKIRLGSIESSTEELKQMAEEISRGPLPEEDREKLRTAIETLIAVAEELETDNATIEGLRALLPDAAGDEEPSSAERMNKD